MGSEMCIRDRERNVILVLVPVLIFGLLSCGGGQSFTGFPGFKEHFDSYPPSDAVPTAQEKKLLEEYKPHIFKSAGEPSPVDFYQDYIASGSLYVEGKKVSDEVTQAILNAYRDNPKALFRYEGDRRSKACLLYTSPSPRDATLSRMPSSA